MKTTRTKDKARPTGKKAGIGLSREMWQWAKANPWFEELMEELEKTWKIFDAKRSRRAKAFPSLRFLRSMSSPTRLALITDGVRGSSSPSRPQRVSRASS